MSLPALNLLLKRETYIPYAAKIIPKSIHQPIVIQKPIVSEDVYWRDYYELSDTVYEWKNGYLEEKPVSDQATFLIYHWFVNVLSMFLSTHPIATCSGLEMGFRLNDTTIRKPDFGVVLNDNLVPLLDSDRSYHGIFDLCVEALSDSDKQEKERDTVTKKAEYAATGVKEYFILHNSKDRAFYRLNAQGVYESICPHVGEVICSEVLPGFQFRIADLLARPSPEDMLVDPVYRDFVLPAWQLDKHQRLEAEQRAQEAEGRAQEAEQRAQTEAALCFQAEQRAAIAQDEIYRLKALLGDRGVL